MTIRIDVVNKRAVYTEAPKKIVCGNPFNIEFTFDEEWNDYDTKKAKLKFYHNGRYEHIEIEFTGNVCSVPALFNIASVEIGVYIDDDFCTTTGAIIECEKSIRCGTSKSVLGAEATDDIDITTLSIGSEDVKKTIHIEVTDGRAIYTESSEKIVCGNPFNIEFTFDEEWEEYDTKKAKIKFWHNGRYEHIIIEFKRNICPVPALFNISAIEIGVFIDNDLCTTTGAIIECEKSIRCGTSKSVLGAEAIDNINKALWGGGGTGENGADGKDGLSAYEIAVKNGFEGTEQEWLASLVGKGGEGTSARIGEVTLTSSGWIGSGSLYSQVVNIDGVTENTQVDLTPSVQQLAAFYEKDLTFVTENEDGVVTVYCIGQKPQNDYTIQVTMTEVLL